MRSVDRKWKWKKYQVSKFESPARLVSINVIVFEKKCRKRKILRNQFISIPLRARRKRRENFHVFHNHLSWNYFTLYNIITKFKNSSIYNTLTKGRGFESAITQHVIPIDSHTFATRLLTIYLYLTRHFPNYIHRHKRDRTFSQRPPSDSD